MSRFGFSLLLLAAVAAGAAERAPRELFAEANRAYEAGEYRHAAQLYEELTHTGDAGGKVFYNLGNAALRAGELGRAIASYRRAQELLPRDPDIAANLAFARRATRDALPAPEGSTVVRALLPWHHRLSRGELLAVALLAHALFWVALGLARLKRSEALRWTSFGALAVLLALGGSYAVRTFFPARTAVVTAQEVEARAADDPAASARFKLHAGSELAVLERRGSWARITLPTGEGGWLEDSAVILVP